MFAKLYGSDDNQLLVKFDANQDGEPELRFYVEPKDLGVCSMAISYNNTPKDWDKAEKVFVEMTEEHARQLAKQGFESLGVNL